MTSPERFDAIIIGTGQGGKPLAGDLAKAGWKTAIIEREEQIGGTCVVRGCTPTKTMIASGRVVYLARRAAEYGVRTGPISVDQEVVRKRKRAIVEMFSGGSRRGMEKLEHIELIMGEARFTAPHGVAVRLNGGGTRRFAADTIVIDVGARPRIPPIDGLDRVSYLDSTSVMELSRVPDHLIILGGGYIGLEFGQLFRRLGSQVTIVESAGRLARREDPDVCAAVTGVLREDGIEVVVNAETQQVGSSNGSVVLTIRTPHGIRNVEGSHLLVAVGRTPNSDALDLPNAGVRVADHGFIPVNEKLETNVPGVYAIGDVNGGPAFTHISYDDYRILAKNFLRGGAATTTGRLVPYTVYIDPQLARVGLNEEQAKTRGVEYAVATMKMDRVARALEVDETRGMIKALVDPASGRILGCTVLGLEGGEIMSMIQIAMMGKVPYAVLRDAIFAHPTLAECLNSLFGRI